MAGFSAGEAIGAGFRLIRRMPWVIPAWALAYFALMLPQLAVYAAAWPRLIPYYQALARSAHGAAPPDPAQMLAFQQQMMSIQGIGWLTAIVASTVMTGAVYRAVLDPPARRWAYLRLGISELWLGVVSLVLMILLMLMIFALIIPLAIAAGIMAAASHGASAAGGGLLIGLAGVAGLAVVVWVLLRLSLALPMSFAERKFLFFESWALTRGHALKMFLVGLAVAVIVWVFEMILVGLFWGAVLGLGGFDLAALQTTPAPQLIRRLIPLCLTLAPVGFLAGAVMFAVMAAPWADIYRQLTRERAIA